jgi:hypothetical protein
MDSLSANVPDSRRSLLADVIYWLNPVAVANPDRYGEETRAWGPDVEAYTRAVSYLCSTFAARNAPQAARNMESG